MAASAAVGDEGDEVDGEEAGSGTVCPLLLSAGGTCAPGAVAPTGGVRLEDCGEGSGLEPLAELPPVPKDW